MNTKPRKILITSALPYANGSLHLGHMVGYIQADIWVRFHKMRGQDCVYVCGDDGHGTPIMLKAQQMGITPEELIAQFKKEHEKDFAEFLVDFDHYHTTHSPENQELAQGIYKRLQDAGDITTRTVKQFYDPKENMFLPDRFIKGQCPRCGAEDQYGDNCEVCGATYDPTEVKNPYSVISGATPIEKESLHYFFQLQHYSDMLKAWTTGGHLQSQVANKLDEWFTAGLRDWDISRDAPYFGFEIPDAPGKYLYVWLDAPVGYMASFKKLCELRPELSFEEYWGKDSQTELYHFIGKDIIYFHALFWPAMLKGAGFRTPTAIFANGFLTVNGKKMSKSRGTFIKARTYLNHLDPEQLRYYFAAKISNRVDDLDINFEDFSQRVNSDLVGKVVNIASRSAGFITKNFDGQLADEIADPKLWKELQEAADNIATLYESREYSRTVREIMALADLANQYIAEQKPWELIKNPDNAEKVQAICTMGINCFRLLMIYLKPIVPELAKKSEEFLNVLPLNWDDKNTPLLNHTVKPFKPLMQRIDEKRITAMQKEAAPDSNNSTEKKAEAPAKTDNIISFDDFAEIDLRVGKVVEAEHVEGADKLIRLMVDIGEEKLRQIFAGIKAAYQPEELLNQSVVIVANLAPRKMRFGVSEAIMIVASPEGDNCWVIQPSSPDAKPRTPVK